MISFLAQILAEAAAPAAATEATLPVATREEVAEAFSETVTEVVSESAAAMTSALTKMSLLQDLSAILLIAGLTAVIFHLMGWPKVIGYIVAGTLMNLPPMNTFLISNQDSVNVLANLGIIFLMFNLGLELNIRKLRRLSGTVFPAAIIDLLLMMGVGFFVGRQILDWDFIPSLFLGAMICDSSTTLLAKSLEEMGCAKTRFASIIFGITITEDILSIGVIAILTGIAMTGHLQATELMIQLGKLGLFLVAVMVIGILVLPDLLNKLISRLKDNETVLLVVMGICFGISLIAEHLNFSLALGSFLVGAVVAESKVKNRITSDTMGLRTVFSAVFFVTIGMMADFAAMWSYKWLILGVCILVVVCKTLNNFIVSYLSGQPFRESFQIGCGLAQIGDFAYLIALLGIELQGKVSPYPEMYQVAVAVSIITTLLNPTLLKNAGGMADGVFKRIPPRFQKFLTAYTSWMGRTSNRISKHANRKVIVRQALFYGINVASLIVFFIIGHWFIDFEPLWKNFPSIHEEVRDSIVWLICSLLATPSMVAGYFTAKKEAISVRALYLPTEESRVSGLYYALGNIAYAVCLLFGIGGMLIAYTALSLSFFSSWLIFIGILLMLVYVAALCYFKRDVMLEKITEVQQTLEDVVSRDEKAEQEEEGTVSLQEVREVVPKESGVIGIPLNKLRLRNHTGCTLLHIIRVDGTEVSMPGPEDCLYAGDTACFVCSEKSKQQVKDFLAKKESPVSHESLASLLEAVLEKITIPENSPVSGKTLAELRLRNQTGVTIVSISRNGKYTGATPGANDVLLPGDEVTFLGNSEQIAATRKFLAVAKKQG